MEEYIEPTAEELDAQSEEVLPKDEVVEQFESSISEPSTEPLAPLVGTLASALVSFEREFDRLKDNIALAFKEIGHGDTWIKISNKD